jgi:hypothetical protein
MAMHGHAWRAAGAVVAWTAWTGCLGGSGDAAGSNAPTEVAAPTPPPTLPTGGMMAAGMGGTGMAGMAGAPPPPPPPPPPPDAGAPDTGTPDAGMPMGMNGAGETGRMVGMTDAHNVVRARMHTPNPSPPLPPMKWSTSIAATAQAYANSCPMGHSMAPGLGENLAFFGGLMSNPTMVVESWAGEEDCWTFGAFFQGDSCNMFCTSAMSSNGCGHYTQIIWRETTEVGCGVATCFGGQEVWVCNYKPPGNFVGMLPY